MPPPPPPVSLTPKAQRVLQLATLAVNRAASEGEARNSALAACRLIVQASAEVLLSLQAQEAGGAPREPVRTQTPGRCPACGQKWHVGETIAWSRGKRAVCMRCHYTGA